MAWVCGGTGDYDVGMYGDIDNDGIANYVDNCPSTYNPDQNVEVCDPANQTHNSGNNNGSSNTNEEDDEEDDDQPTETIIGTSPLDGVTQLLITSIQGCMGTNNQTLNDWLFSDATTQSDISAMNTYLVTNQCGLEAKNFSLLASDALMEGGDVDWDEKIINKLTGKANCIYKKIKEQNGVRMILNKFQETNSPANLILENASLGNYFGNTISPDATDFITVQLNNDYGFWGVDYQPNALVAQTIFHEIIHAEFFREIVVAIGEGNFYGATPQEVINAWQNNSYPTLYEYYRTYQDWSHNFMADYYRDTIARVTQEFATGIPVAGNEQPQQLYMDLAWRGLRDDEFILAWIELAEDEKQAVDNTINNYITNNSNQTCTE